MEFLKERYERRKKYFKNLEKYLKEIKKIVLEKVPDAKIYLFGSVLRENYSIGLSDIDIAIVSERFKDRNLKLEIFGMLLKKYFDSPFEFHILTKEQWEFYKRFVKEYREI